MMTQSGYAGRSSGGVRATALAVTILLHVCAAIVLTIRFYSSPQVQGATAPMVVEMLPAAAESTPENDPVAEDPQPPTEQQPVQPQQNAPAPAPALRFPPIAAQNQLPAEPVTPAPTSAATAQPRPAPASPPAAPSPPTRPASPRSGPDSWEGRVLARIDQMRRYPSAARTRRQQGVVHIRFRAARDGRVMFAALERSSGNASLDRAALETIRRAEPLPPIPEDRPDEIELVVPVEFFLR